MSYQKDLDFLIRGIGAEAFQGGDALQMLMQARAERDERRYARKQQAQEMQGGLLETLLSGAQSAATEGTELDDLITTSGLTAQFSGAPPAIQQQALTSVMPALESLYFTNPESKMYGMSRVSPMLGDEERADIIQEALAARSQGTMSVQAKQALISRAQEMFGPKVFAQVVPEIEKIVDDIYTGQ